MVSRSEDVYREFIDDPEMSWEFGLVAFAVIEEQRIEWMDHYEQQNGNAPTPEDIQHWYEQQSPAVMLRAKGTAENALQLYSEDVVEEALKAEQRNVADSVIVREIRLANRFWPRFGANVAAGFISALSFALLLAALAFIILSDSSPVKLGLGKVAPTHQVEETTDGEKTGKE